MTDSVQARFWKFVAPADNGCWNWTGYLGTGYGLFRLNGRAERAHRLSYSWLVSPIEKSLVLDHLCRNRACVNPAHLEPVSFRENILRGVGPTAINARKTHCAHGHPYSEENTAHRKNKNVPRTRVCRECERKSSREYQKRKRASL